MMESLRILLFPFSVLYDGVTKVRNWAFDKGYLEQKSFDIPIIAVGNLSTGGTGKTPMIEWLIEKHQHQRIGVLSRGYGRKTRGFKIVTTSSHADEVGDEPLQIKKKYGSLISSAVCEKRVLGIEKLLDSQELDTILLDDAFQHRHVKASHYILLTSFNEPYYKDLVLPAGNLRESRTGAQRAQTIVVTKCPSNLTDTQQQEFIERIKPQKNQQVCFSTIEYDSKIQNNQTNYLLDELIGKKITLVTGIANPAPLVRFLSKRFEFEHLKYGDHHRFRESEIKEIAAQEIVITTEKDYMRLSSYQLENVYFIGMKMKFIGSTPEL